LGSFAHVGSISTYSTPTFQTHKEKNMNIIIFAGLLVIAIVVLAAFLAGFVMVAREHMAIDERLHRYTH
jgi:hypothetical protein